MKYGILSDGVLGLSPARIILNGKQIWNPSEDQLIQAGYKEIRDTDMPEDPAPEGQHYESYYEGKGNYIEMVWIIVDDPEPEPVKPTIESRVSDLETLSQPLLVVSSYMAQELPDNQAMEVISLYPVWEELCDKLYKAEKSGFKFSYGDKLYKTVQDNFTFQSQWIPGQGTSAIYTQIVESQMGTLDNPIDVPSDVNTNAFTYVIGKYYSWQGKIYKCQRQGEEEGMEHSFNYSPDTLLSQYFILVE